MEAIENGPPPTSFSEPHCERSATIWFDDGNLVLRTKMKQYRVYRGVLSARSSVFRDMLSIPQPDSQETIDGCPVVDLADSAQDWDALLEVMYSNEDMLDQQYCAIPFETLRAALVLGTKYDFERYRDMALIQLEKLFPLTLRDWDATYDLRDDFYSWRAFELLELVLSFGHRTMLPAAYCGCISAFELGTTDILDKYRQQNERPLPFDVLDKLVLSSGWIQRVLWDKLLKWCWDDSVPSNDCLDRAVCTEMLRDNIRDLFQHLYSFLAPYDGSASSDIGLCTKCEAVAAIEYTKGRESIWLDLPLIFGLPDWESLRE